MSSLQIGENSSSNESPMNSAQTSARPKLYKIRQHLDDYYDVCLEHKNQELTRINEFYMDIELTTVRHFQQIIAQINKLVKLFNVYCLFYHAIWWQNTKFNITLSFLNFGQIDKFLLITLVYFNLGQVFVRDLLLRSLAFGCFKWLNWFSTHTLKTLLNWSELCIYALVEFYIYNQLKNERKYSNMRIVVLFVPHLFVLFLNNFVVHVRIFNVDLFSNSHLTSSKDSHSSKQQQQQQQAEVLLLQKGPTSSSKFVYEDCSNISIDKYLNQSVLQVPHLTSAQSPTSKWFASRTHLKRSTSLSSTSWPLVAKLKNLFYKCVHFFTTFKTYKRMSKTVRLVYNSVSLQTSQLTKSCAFRFHKRSMFHSIAVPFVATSLSSSSTSSSHNATDGEQAGLNHNMQHRCHTNSASIRDECELFANEYNSRMKQVLLHTFDVIYTNFVLVYLNAKRDTINIRIVELLLYLFASVLNVYLNLHTWHMPHWFHEAMSRNAEHMGQWRHISCNKQQTTSKSQLDKWIASKIYCLGDRVIHMGEVYKAESKFCSSEPGNCKQTKFYSFFIDAHRKSARHLFMLNMFISFMLIYLLYNQRWYGILAFFLELVINTHLIYIVYRDYFLSKQLQLASEQDEPDKKKKS